jgi:hypothetical protein
LWDTTEKGDRGAKPEEIGGETEGDFTNNSNIHILFFSFWSIFENLEPEMGSHRELLFPNSYGGNG